MTSGGAGDPRASIGKGLASTTAPAWTVAAAAALFLLLFWPIVAVRYHFYLETPSYSHCVLLPVVSALWIYDRWDTLRTVPRSACGHGLALLVVASLVFVYGRMLNVNFIQHAAMMAGAVCLVWALAGAALLRALAFPLGYLVLMMPLHKTWDDRITVTLQGFATAMAETFFRAIGWVVVREGNVIQLPRIKLLVEEGCSGIHSLYALVALAVAWVFFVERPAWLRATLIAAAVPIAVIANAMRVSVTGVLAYKVDPSYAQGVSHQTAGMIVFAIGLVLLLGVDWCLKPDAAAAKSDDAGSA